MKLPLYFNCYLFDKKNDEIVFTYKIDASDNPQYPFQLYKLVDNDWENLSFYVSIEDALKILLKELLSKELAEEVYFGQARVSPTEILGRIGLGERSITICDADNKEAFRLEYDIMFEDMVQRK